MSCSNCFNGCSEITSDKCVKYTGVDIPILGIKNGDSLSYIEQTLIGFLVSTLDGSGIKPDMSKFDFCALVQNNLPTCGDVTIVDIEQALNLAVCTVNDLITQLTSTVDTINLGYTVGCLTTGSITDASAIHEILQALIDNFCIVQSNLTALTNNVNTNYVALADLNSLIQAYLDSISVGGMMSSKMIPFTVVEYYGNLTNYPTISDGFGPTGVGYGAWLNIFLCNGLNGTPDKRGRVGVGDTISMGGGPLDADRAAFVYQKGVAIAVGVNTITLSAAQMPAHTHTAVVAISDPEHFHYQYNTNVGSEDTGAASLTSTTFPNYKSDTLAANDFRYLTTGDATIPTIGRTASALSGINSTNVSVTNVPTGLSAAHNNIQPGMGCYYIMYIP